MRSTEVEKIERLKKALSDILEVRVSDPDALDKCRAIAARNLYKENQ